MTHAVACIRSLPGFSDDFSFWRLGGVRACARWGASSPLGSPPRR